MNASCYSDMLLFPQSSLELENKFQILSSQIKKKKKESVIIGSKNETDHQENSHRVL